MSGLEKYAAVPALPLRYHRSLPQCINLRNLQRSQLFKCSQIIYNDIGSIYKFLLHFKSADSTGQKSKIILITVY